jgi:drug/metabolite transporter (DMT)-like permease
MPAATHQLAVVVNDRKARNAFAVLLLGAASIALAPIFVRLSVIGPVPTAFWRAALAVPFLSALVPVFPAERGKARWPRRPQHLLGFTLAGLMFAGDLSFWHLSIAYTTVANSTLFANMAPIFVTVFGFVLFGTRFTRLFLSGMALALVGAVVLMGDSLTVAPQHVLGDALGLVTAMFYGAYFIAIARLRVHYGAVTVMALATPFTALFLIPPTLMSAGPYLPDGLHGWAVLLALAVVSQSLGQGLIAYAFAHLPAAFGSVSLLLQPVLSAVFAWVLFDEALGPLQGLGMAIVLAGVLIARQGTLVSR